ncbi:MAG: tetratricopeptide repeat protein [Acidimicrobiia bacterium]|nr:tetratricopeptide repeat protein [Acidimicrobiia bacterium]
MTAPASASASASPSASAVDLDALADLEEQRRFLLQSLKDLDREREAGDIDEHDYGTLKDDYTARAAAVLHAIDERKAGLARAQGGARRRRSRKWMALIVAAVVLVAIGGGALVASTSGERVPGQTATGNVPSNTSDQLAAAQQDLAQGKAVDALKLYDQVLQRDPANAQALTFRGWILESANLHDQALASLDKALAADPTFAMAHYFKGAVLFEGKNDPADAVKEFEAFLASNPPADAAKTAQDALNQAKQAAGQK